MLSFNPNMTAGQAYDMGNPAGRSIRSAPLPLLGDNAGMGMGQTGRPGGGGMWGAFAQPQAASGFFDPATGQMIRTPTTAAEMAEAEREGRNLALKSQASATEAAINKGTEEISESEREAQRVAGQAGAAAGVTNPADMQRGQQRIMSQYSGQRANLARDIRMRQADQQRGEDASMFGRMFAYSQAARQNAKQDDDERVSNINPLRRLGVGSRSGSKFGGVGGLGGRPKEAIERTDALGRGLPKF